MSLSKEKWWLETSIGNAIVSAISLHDKAFGTRKRRIVTIATVFSSIGLLIYLRKKYDHRPRKEKKDEDIILEEGKSRIDAHFFKRLKWLLKISVPLLGMESVYIVGLVIVIIIQAMVNSKANAVSGDLMFNMARRDLESWWWNWSKITTLYTFNSLLTPIVTYLMDMLALRIRNNLTMDIHSRYYKDIIYYKMTNTAKNKVSNPDQRITQDVELWSHHVTRLFTDALAPLLDVFIYSHKMTQLIGIGGPVSIWMYLIVAFAMISLVTPNFSKMSAQQQALEGKFRYIHARTRLNAESIAFYGGDEKERSIIEKTFEELTNYSNVVINKNFLFGVVNDYWAKYCPHSFSTIVAAIPGFFGRLREYPVDERMGKYRYLTAVITFEFYALGRMITLFRKLLKLSGFTDRITSLYNSIDQIEATKERSEFLPSDSISFENVSIYTPGDQLLAKHLTFSVEHGFNTIITGPNGSGKSSLFRVLGGLWPLREGIIRKPGGQEHGLHKDIFYLPQKPYNVIGTLREQLIYPDHKSTMSDNALHALLSKFGIGYLATRHREGFNSVQDWDMLSRGEQQRLAVARLFYHEPRYAILDECTSCMNKDAEIMLYESCKQHNITCITISHRPALDQFHDYRLIFNGECGWRYERITDKKNGEGRIGEIIRSG